MTGTKWTAQEIEDNFLFLTFTFDDSPHLCIDTLPVRDEEKVVFFCCNARTLVRYEVSMYNLHMLMGFIQGDECVIELGEFNVLPEWKKLHDIRFLM